MVEVERGRRAATAGNVGLVWCAVRTRIEPANFVSTVPLHVDLHATHHDVVCVM